MERCRTDSPRNTPARSRQRNPSPPLPQHHQPDALRPQLSERTRKSPRKIPRKSGYHLRTRRDPRRKPALPPGRTPLLPPLPPARARRFPPRQSRRIDPKIQLIFQPPRKTAPQIDLLPILYPNNTLVYSPTFSRWRLSREPASKTSRHESASTTSCLRPL